MPVSAGLDNVVRFRNVAEHNEIAALTGHQRRIHFVTFSHDGAWVATAGMDRNVKLWNVPKEPSPQVSEQSSKGKEEPREASCQRPPPPPPPPTQTPTPSPRIHPPH